MSAADDYPMDFPADFWQAIIDQHSAMCDEIDLLRDNIRRLLAFEAELRRTWTPPDQLRAL